MPYVPLSDGQLIFVETQEEADRLYNESWGQGAAAEAQPAAPQQPAPAEQQQEAAPTAQAQPEVPEERTSLRSEQERPLTKYIEDLGRAGVDGLRQIVDQTYGMGEMMAELYADVEAGLGDTAGMIAGGPALGGSLNPNALKDPDVLREELNNAGLAFDAVVKTGKNPEGFSYGIKPSVPVLGPLFSEESDLVDEYVKPKTAPGKFVSGVVSIIGADKIAKKIGLNPNTAPALAQVFKAEGAKQKINAGTRYLFKTFLPELVGDSIYFGPDLPPELNQELEEVRAEATPELRRAAMKTLLARDDIEFEYASAALENLYWGAGTVLGVDAIAKPLLKKIFKIGNNSVQDVQNGVPINEAIDKRVDEGFKEVEEVLSENVYDMADTVRDERLGQLNTLINRRIEENVSKIALSSRSGAENYITKQTDVGPRLKEALDAVDEIPDIGEELPQISARVNDLQKAAGVSSVDQLEAKRVMLTKRIEDYNRAAAADPEWINKSTGTGKRKTKNSTKVRKATQALARLADLEQANIELKAAQEVMDAREAGFSKVNELLREGGESSLGFRNSLNDARTLINSIEELDKERIGLLKNRNSALFEQNRLDEINNDLKLPGPLGEAYRELKDLVDSAEIANNFGNLNEEFMRNFVLRAEAIENKIMEVGGMQPIVPEMPKGTPFDDEFKQLEIPLTGEEAVPPELSSGIPRTAAAVELPAPITKNEAGELAIDSNKITNNIQLKTTRPRPTSVSNQQVIDQLNRRQNKMLDPADNAEEFLDNLDEMDKINKDLLAAGRTEEAIEATKWRNTNSIKYATSWTNAKILKLAIKRQQENARWVPAQAAEAVFRLSALQGYDKNLARIQTYLQAEKIAKKEKKDTNVLITVLALLDTSSTQLLRDARDMRAIVRQENADALIKEQTLRNFKNSYVELQAGVKAVTELMDVAGNRLQLFGKARRLVAGPSINDIFNSYMKAFGDVDELSETLAKNAKKAKVEMDAKFNDVFERLDNGEEVSQADLEGLEDLADQIYMAQGDLKKLQDLQVTDRDILARIQVNASMSGPDLFLTMPVDGVANGIQESALRAVGYGVNGYWAKWVTQNPEVSEAAIKEARISAGVMYQWLFSLNEGFEMAYRRFVYGKQIADPKQLTNKAYEMAQTGGIRREEAINQDLSAESLNIPFINYVLERKKNGDDKLFDAINKARVLTKVFHDYTIPGEAWNLRGPAGKVLGGFTSLTRGITKNIPLGGEKGLGTHSYYPGGEYMNLSLATQIAGSADEFVTTLFAHGRAKAEAKLMVDDLIASGTYAAEDRAKMYRKHLAEAKSRIYKDKIRVGYDQRVIGRAVNEEKVLEMTRAINLVEELTGPLGDMEDAINVLRNSKNPQMAAFSRHVIPYVVSPANAIKRAVKYAYGGQVANFALDIGRLGFKEAAGRLPEKVIAQADAMSNGGLTKHVLEFESKYFSEDMAVRSKAQGALAVSAGIMTTTWAMVNMGEHDITGGMEHTYRQGEAVRKPYTWLINGEEYSYRWWPIIGPAIAFHANLRDMDQHGTNPMSDLVSFALATTANTIMEVPALAGIEQLFKVVSSTQDGNVNRLQKFLADGAAKAGDPYLNLRKFLKFGVDPRKPADALGRFKLPFTERFKTERTAQGEDVGFAKQTAQQVGDVASMAVSMIANSYEDTPFTFIAEAMMNEFNGDEDVRLRSRKSIWYGKPEETVKANHAGIFWPLQSVFGRYMPFSTNQNDIVNREMLNNMISPPAPNMFAADGVKAVDKTVLNNFGFYLNTEYTFYSPRFRKTYTGVNEYLRDVIKDPLYQSLPSLDSPYAMGNTFSEKEFNWDRENNSRRAMLMKEVRALYSGAKEKFLQGDQPNQRFKAPENLKQYINTQRGMIK
jgi:hypothetical protein